MSRAFVSSTAALARVLGVGRTAVKMAARGMISCEKDGRWDVVAALQGWRHGTSNLLQRHQRARVFRPWLDLSGPLVDSIWAEFVRRADAQGAEWADDSE
jgi:hypothetical protein